MEAGNQRFELPDPFSVILTAIDELNALLSLSGSRACDLVKEAGNQGIALIDAKPDGFVAGRAPDILMRLHPTSTLLEILAAVRAGDAEVDKLLARLRRKMGGERRS